MKNGLNCQKCGKIESKKKREVNAKIHLFTPRVINSIFSLCMHDWSN